MSEKHISALAAAERIHDNLESALQDYLDDHNDGRGYVAKYIFNFRRTLLPPKYASV